MNTIFFMFFSSIFFITTLFPAESQESIFMQANKLYYEHKFKDALSLYTLLSYKSSAIWENMGNCSYYLDDYAHALVYWRKAERLAGVGRFTILQDHIEQAYNQLHIENEKKWYEGIQTFIFMYLYNDLPYWLLPILFLISWIIFVFFAFRYYKKNMRFIIGGLVSIVFSGIFYNIGYQYQQRKIGIVISSHTSLHTGTDEKLPVIAHLKLGQAIKITQNQQDWYQVLAGPYMGWVHRQMIEIV